MTSSSAVTSLFRLNDPPSPDSTPTSPTSPAHHHHHHTRNADRAHRFRHRLHTRLRPYTHHHHQTTPNDLDTGEGEGGEKPSARRGSGVPAMGVDDESDFEFVGMSDTDSEDVPAGALTTHINIGCVFLSFSFSFLLHFFSSFIPFPHPLLANTSSSSLHPVFLSFPDIRSCDNTTHTTHPSLCVGQHQSSATPQKRYTPIPTQWLLNKYSIVSTSTEDVVGIQHHLTYSTVPLYISQSIILGLRTQPPTTIRSSVIHSSRCRCRRFD